MNWNSRSFVHHSLDRRVIFSLSVVRVYCPPFCFLYIHFCSFCSFSFFPHKQLQDPDAVPSEEDDVNYIIIILAAAALVLLMICGCFCCHRHRKGKEGRADQMRRNLGYTPDMESKGDGNFGPTNKHVAITRGGGPTVTPEMLPATNYQQTYPMHQRAPSEAPSSVIEDNIANNYRPKKAAKVREACVFSFLAALVASCCCMAIMVVLLVAVFPKSFILCRGVAYCTGMT